MSQRPPRMTAYKEPAPNPYRGSTYRCAGCGDYFEGSPEAQSPHYCLRHHCVKKNKESTLSRRSRKALAELAMQREPKFWRK